MCAIVLRGFGTNSHGSEDERGERLGYIDAYRGLTVLITCYSILAVDFNAFPRRHAKTEERGVSLMDLGSGTAVFSAGLVAGHPRRLYAPSADFQWTFCALVGIGVARLLSIKTTGYTEHVSEYGIHWNFFFTLAATLAALKATVIGVLKLSKESIKVYLAVAATIVAVTHQLFLSSYWVGAEKQVLRTGLLSANKEGIVSLPGYYVLVCFGAVFGSRIFSSSWTLMATLQMALVSWAVVGCVLFFGVAPSRKSANLGYCALVSAINLSMILVLASFDAVLPTASKSCTVLVRLSRRQFPVFLCANILTGGINVMINTLTISTPIASYAILRPYMVLITATPAIADAFLAQTVSL